MTDREAAVIRVEDLAARLDIGRRAAYEAVARGDVPGVIRIGRSIRISRQAVDRWLAGESQDKDDG